MEIDMANRLLELRKDLGYSQEKLAESLGVTRQAVSKWENGQGLPDAGNLLEISKLYCVSVDYLLTGVRQTQPAAPAPTPKGISPFRVLALVLLGFAGVSLVGVLFIFLLALLTSTAFGG